MSDDGRGSDAGAQVVPIGSARGHKMTGKKAIGLTEEERQFLLGELAEITAELDELKHRTAEIAGRVTAYESVRQARPA